MSEITIIVETVASVNAAHPEGNAADSDGQALASKNNAKTSENNASDSELLTANHLTELQEILQSDKTYTTAIAQTSLAESTGYGGCRYRHNQPRI